MPFAIALAVSVLLHAAAIVMPGWALPGDAEPEPQPLEARLVLPAQPAPVAAAAPKPHPRPTRRAPPATPVDADGPAPAAAAPEAVAAAAEPDAAAAAPAVVVPPAPVALPPPPPPSPPWAHQGHVRYLVRYGDGGFIIGERTEAWRIDGEHYAIRSSFEPKGLAALRGRTRTQTSSGEVTAAGLRPHEFRDQREGRDADVATFDWAGAQIVFSGGRAAGRLADGTEDLTSVFYQLAWLAPRQDVEFAVATGSRVGRWTFEWVGEEKLELATGIVATLHLRTRADGDSTEVWLAPAYGGLPVKIRYVDRKGDAFEQTADLLDLN
ncbi:MAG: DUF3108 domain-containing protein [Rhodocyclaceae bacterium]|nr:DUF3108 domain-containing protein [Rhodocyclaceae bacterium]